MLAVLFTAALLVLSSAQGPSEDVTSEDPAATSAEPEDQSQRQVSEAFPDNEVENNDSQNQSLAEAGQVSSAADGNDANNSPQGPEDKSQSQDSETSAAGGNEVKNPQQATPAGGVQDQPSPAAENPQGPVKQGDPQDNSHYPGHHYGPADLFLPSKRNSRPSVHRKQGSIFDRGMGVIVFPLV
ncbi:putative Acidic proline-rich protein PRP33 [Cricetulus griseus]|nr:putative Acidic proline-rich protein PRP33 [Cricetulus griseus]